MYFLMLFLYGLTPISYVKEINYCGTIKFHAGIFDYSKIQKASRKEDCHDNPVPIYYKGVKGYFNLTSSAYATGGASYIIWDKTDGNYHYDEDELKDTIRNVIYNNPKYKYLSHLTFSVKINYQPRPNGALVISDVIFKDMDGKGVSIIKDAFFYSKDNYAAVYGSQPIKFTDKSKIELLEGVNDLFNTMVIDWN